MKKIILCLFLIFGLSVPCLADSTVKFAWDPNPESDLAGYRLYQTDVKGEYVLDKEHAVATIPAGTEVCTLPHVIDGEHWWILTAFDNHDNESGKSNEVGVDLDTVGPGAPGIRLISAEVNK